MKRVSNIPVMNAKRVGELGMINHSEDKAAIVRDVLNALGAYSPNIAVALSILDDAKDTLLYCTRMDNEYMLTKEEMGIKSDRHPALDQMPIS